MNDKVKKICFSLTAFILGMAIFFAIGEVMFRIFRGPPNPLADITQQTQRFLFKPNDVIHQKSSIEGEFEYDVHINAFGYRGDDFQMPKPQGKVRIFAVGDSFTFGVGAPDQETIPYRLDEYLRGQGYEGVEVVNAGIGHACPFKHYLNFHKIHLQYQPDVVLLLLDLTDLWDDWNAQKHAIYNKEGEIVGTDRTFIDGKRSWWLTAVNYSKFCQWIHKKIVRSFEKIFQLGVKDYVSAVLSGQRAKAVIATSHGTVSDDDIMEHDGLIMMRGRDRKELIDRNWQRTGGYILKIRDLLKAKGIPMVLIMYPHGIYVGADQWKEGRKTWGFEEGQVYTDHYAFELVQGFADQNNIPFINVLPDFLAAPPQKYFYDWDGHMTPSANVIVAKSIVQNAAFQKILKNVLSGVR